MPYIKRDFALCQAILDQLVIILDANACHAERAALDAVYRQAYLTQEDATLASVFEATAEQAMQTIGTWDVGQDFLTSVLSCDGLDMETHYLATEALVGIFVRRGAVGEAVHLVMIQMNPVVRLELAVSAAASLHARGHHAAAEQLLGLAPEAKRRQARRAGYEQALNADFALGVIEFLTLADRLAVISSTGRPSTGLVENMQRTFATLVVLNRTAVTAAN